MNILLMLHSRIVDHRPPNYSKDQIVAIWWEVAREDRLIKSRRQDRIPLEGGRTWHRHKATRPTQTRRSLQLAVKFNFICQTAQQVESHRAQITRRSISHAKHKQGIQRKIQIVQKVIVNLPLESWVMRQVLATTTTRRVLEIRSLSITANLTSIKVGPQWTTTSLPSSIGV